MSGEVLLSATPFGLRAAVCDDAGVSQLFVESALRPSRVGDVHLGLIARIVPQLGGAFVALGDGAGEGWLETTRGLEPGEALLVQIASDARGRKGARLSLTISLAGRGLVFLPARKRPVVSRRIQDEAARERLRALLASLDSDRGGIVARRDAALLSDHALEREVARLSTLSRDIEAAQGSAVPPRRLYAAGGLIGRLLRDHLFDRRLIVDDRAAFDAAASMAASRFREVASSLVLAENEPDLFERHDAHGAFDAALSARQPFEGGALAIETTEALTAIDVDVSGASLTEAVRRAMNVAGRAILQRNLGGLIVLDPPRMRSARAREAMVVMLRAALDPDRAQNHVHGVTPAGLIELTRQRLGESVTEALTEVAETDRGRHPRLDALAFDLAAAARRAVRRGARRLAVYAAPALLDLVDDWPGSGKGGFSRWLGRPVEFVPEAAWPTDRFEVETH